MEGCDIVEETPNRWSKLCESTLLFCDMNTDHTLEEVGQQFSVTRERIRQIEAKALRKLKHPSRSRKLRSFLDN